MSPGGDEGRLYRHAEPSRLLYLLHHVLERDMVNSFDLELAYELAEVNLVEIDVLVNIHPPVYRRVPLGQRLPLAVEQGAILRAVQQQRRPAIVPRTAGIRDAALRPVGYL